MLFSILLAVYMLFLTTVVVCNIWLLYSNCKLSKQIQAVKNFRSQRWQQYRNVEAKFLKGTEV